MPEQYERWLRLLLRVTGGVMLLALVAVVMPRSWMAAAHEWLGVGAFPDAPIAEYLARSTSGLYAMLGGLAILLAADVRTYRRAITYFALALPALSTLMLLACWNSGLPAYWLLTDLFSAAGFGAAVLVLQRLAGRP